MNFRKVKIGFFTVCMTASVFFFLWYRGQTEESKSILKQKAKVSIRDKMETTASATEKRQQSKNFLRNLAYARGNQDETSTEEDGSANAEPNVLNLPPVELARDAIRNSIISKEFINRAPDLMDRMLQEEMKDPVWTHMVTQRLNEQLLIQKDSAAAEIEEIDCYETMCRIVTTHDSLESAEQFHAKAAETDGLDGPGHRFARINDNAAVVSIKYLARIGDDESVHDDVYNRMYEEITGSSVENIEPTDAQINQIQTAYADRN